MFDGHEISVAMAVYMAAFNIISCSITGLRLWLWVSARYPAIGSQLSPDWASIIGGAIGAAVTYAALV